MAQLKPIKTLCSYYNCKKRATVELWVGGRPIIEFCQEHGAEALKAYNRRVQKARR